MAELFLKGGVVAKLKGVHVPEQVLPANASRSVWDLPLAVLVDNGTAGAGEIVAAALLDAGPRAARRRAHLRPRRRPRRRSLLEEGGLVLTVAKYYVAEGQADPRQGRRADRGGRATNDEDADDDDEASAKRPHPGEGARGPARRGRGQEGRVNKAELVARMARESGLTKADANRAVDAFTTLVTRALKKGERVKLAGFGTFLVSRRKARVVLNPTMKAPVKIPSRRTARFTSSKELRAVLRVGTLRPALGLPGARHEVPGRDVRARRNRLTVWVPRRRLADFAGSSALSIGSPSLSRGCWHCPPETAVPGHADLVPVAPRDGFRRRRPPRR